LEILVADFASSVLAPLVALSVASALLGGKRFWWVLGAGLGLYAALQLGIQATIRTR
jgi:hypothetical protein